MGREDKSSGRGDPENRRSTSRSGGARKQSSFLVRPFAASEKGRSGYGSESVRPYLRAQLKLKELLGSPFTPLDPWERLVRKKIRNDTR